MMETIGNQGGSQLGSITCKQRIFICQITGQSKVPIGEASIATLDTVIASETCEELFTPASPHIYLGLNGIEIISNGSGSHHQLRKLHTRIDLMKNATAKGGGVYLYANQQGCDGGRLYFDGCAMILMNGEVLAQGSQFSLKDVEVVTATVNLDDVRSYRGGITSRGIQAAESQHVPRFDVAFSLHKNNLEKIRMPPTKPQTPKYVTPEEEIAYGPACWLWDYLRRSGMNGFFLPLSGGADSSAVATICAIMCELIVKECGEGNEDVKKDIQRVLNQPSYEPKDPKDLCNKLLFTCYMGTKNSSEETRLRAEKLANQIGANHMALTIDDIVASFQNTFIAATNKIPQFKVNGGTHNENLALQNIQARSRMVMSYFLSQLLLWTTGRPGSLLVLGTANVDEALRGYFTKYDCSSADVNPIGGISKTDLKRFLQWAAKEKGFSVLDDVVTATPTAELEPITATYVQSDEVDMGMTYQELSVFGRLRKVQRCGPYTMFEKLLCEWTHLQPKEVADKVKRFFFYYSINRHKMTILTPSYHAESYSPDDNRFDLRQFLYNSKWTWQFEMIDKEVEKLSSKTQSNLN
mmetsp:Transcript_10331/g.14167  ORF Transcript_10331/g.14167 Transcript_10331/m.14167 type:complete len:581 (-) Transcript_10331:68-1810(-)